MDVSRIGCVHVLTGSSPVVAPDIVDGILAAPAAQQTIVCVGPSAAGVAYAFCQQIGRRSDVWRALCAVMDIVCPGGAERVVFLLDAAGAVCGVQWDAPLPPYDAAPLLAALRRMPYAGDHGDAGDNAELTQFIAHLAVLSVDAAMLWRAGDALDALCGGNAMAAAARLALDVRLIHPCMPMLARMLHRRIIDWLAGHLRSPRSRPVRTLAVCVEPMAAPTPSFECMCRLVVADMMHAALDAAFVAADRDERAADGCVRGTAAPGRYSCDYAATTLRTALADAADGRALVAALGASPCIEHVRGRLVYADVAAWHAHNRNVDAGAAQQLLGLSALSPLMRVPRGADRRGSAILLSPGRAPPSVFGARLDATAALLDGATRLHWVCCNDPDTVRRLRVLQRAAGPLHVRLPVGEFVARYACVAPRVPRQAAAILAATVGHDGQCAHIGPHQVWLTTRAADCLEQLVGARRQHAAICVQAWWRGLRCRRRSPVRVRPPSTPPDELAVLRAVVATAFAAEHAWERVHVAAAAPAYAGLVPALLAALTSARLATVPGATAAVVLRLMRYGGWTPMAYDALGAAVLDCVRLGRATPTGAAAVAAVAAADARADAGLLLRLWLAVAQAAVQRVLGPERAVLTAVVGGVRNDVVQHMASAAWQRVDAGVGEALRALACSVADGWLMSETRRPDAETAVLCAEWLSRTPRLSVPRWRSALAVAMLPDRGVLREAAARAQVCPLLTGGELAALGVDVGRVVPGPLAPVRVPAVDVGPLWAQDVSFY